MSLRSQLIRDEGIRLAAYKDSRGNYTIGVGHRLSDPITMDAAMLILDDDIAVRVAEVQRELPWTEALDQVRFDVLVNMCFNLGIGNLLNFHQMLVALQLALDTDGDFKPVAAAMRDSDWWRNEVRARAERLAVQMETGREQ